MTGSVNRTDGVTSSNNVVIYKGDNSSDNPGSIFNIPRLDLTGMTAEQAAEAIKQYDNLINTKYYEQRTAIMQNAIDTTGRSPFSKNITDEVDNADKPYHNKNASGKSPVAQYYSLTLKATYKDKENRNGQSYERNMGKGQVRSYGQRAIKGNDVPIANTFIAFLTNNNPSNAAIIENTTVDDLVENFFSSADSIQKSEVEGIQRRTGQDGTDEITFTNVDDGEVKFLKSLDNTVIKNNNNLSKDEINIVQWAYAADTQILVAAAEAKGVSGESLKRLDRAKSVDIDSDDPYQAFFKKAGASDGREGISRDELKRAIDAISEKEIDPKTGKTTLKFSADKLQEYLRGTDQQ